MKESKVIQASLQVSRKEYLTPHFIRVYLTGDTVLKLMDCVPGTHLKILIPPVHTESIHFPEYGKKKKAVSKELAPWTRTYTLRGTDFKNKEVWIDFAAHGSEGPASAWAINAQPGNVLGIMVKRNKKMFYNHQADYYILAGDATAIPVLSCILEDLPPTAKGCCLIEVYSPEDEQKLKTKADMQFVWVHNPKPKKGSKLTEVFKKQNFPADNKYAYIAAEKDTVKQIQHYLKKEKKWKKDEFYTKSYWKSGKSSGKKLKK